MQHNFNIHQIIEENLVQATFQPIVSLKSGGISGYEGLIRGIHPESRISISPIDLFSESPREGCTVRLDRLCRTTILDAFAREILPCEPDALLFINFESSVIDAGIVGSNHILDAVDQAGIPHESIVLEIIESRVFDTNRLKDFVTAYRQRGFLFALDDIGAGHSNLDRIGLVAPDIMKIDRALCAGISTSDIHREIFRALTQLGHNIGSLVLAEGVEEEDDVILASLLGADLHQGFYFGRPGFYAELDRQQCLTSISHAASLVKKIRLNTHKGVPPKALREIRL